MVRKHDKRLAKLVPLLVSSSVGGFAAEKGKFQSLLALETLSEAHNKTLVSTPDKLRTAARIPDSMDPAMAQTIISAWVSEGFAHVAAATFTLLFPVIKDEQVNVVIPLLSTVEIVDWWGKQAKVAKSDLLKIVMGAPQKYQNTVLFEWAIKHSPIKLLHHLLKPIFSDIDQIRPPTIASNKVLLVNILRRDRLAALAPKVLAEAQLSSQSAVAFLDAIQNAPRSWPAWTMEMAPCLWSQTDIDTSNMLRDEILRRISKGPDESAQILSIVTAYSLTHHQMALVSNQKAKVSVKLLPELVKAIFVRAGMSPDIDFWIAAPAAEVRSVFEEADRKISSLGAQLFAQGLRAMEDTNDPRRLLTAVASNLGMIPVGEVGQIALFDPEMHEDTSGGLLPGHKITVHSSGWRHADRIIMRAIVKSHA